MKKVFIFIFAIIFVNEIFAQAIKPSMMVMPSKTWCHEHGYEKKQTKENGKVVATYDYERALIEYRELGPAIRKIGELMQQRGFTLVDFQTLLESSSVESALDDFDDEIESDPEAEIIKAAGTDIILRINWFVQTVMGGRQQITYELTAFDSYTNKQVANTGNTSPPQAPGQPEVVLLQNAVIGQQDQFVAQLMSFFQDMQQKGREISVRINTVSGWEDGLETELGDDEEELTDIINKWIVDNSVEHRYHKASGTKKSLYYDSVRIPLFSPDGSPISAEDWVKQLRRYLRKNYKVPCKVRMRGLGQAQLKVGETDD